MILKKELQDRIEDLEKEVKHLEDSRDALTKRIDQIVDSKGEVERKLFEAQQLIEHETSLARCIKSVIPVIVGII
jgi:predicted  nucleic acid-binding Zn-ribbon protein